MPARPVNIVLDTDAFNEIDDQFAIAHALTAEKSICKLFGPRHCARVGSLKRMAPSARISAMLAGRALAGNISFSKS